MKKYEGVKAHDVYDVMSAIDDKVHLLRVTFIPAGTDAKDPLNQRAYLTFRPGRDIPEFGRIWKLLDLQYIRKDQYGMSQHIVRADNYITLSQDVVSSYKTVEDMIDVYLSSVMGFTDELACVVIKLKEVDEDEHIT